MREYLLITVVVLLLPFCFARPYIGIAAWTWISLMNPHRLVWGFTYGTIPFAFIIAVPTIAGFLKEIPRIKFHVTKEIVLLVLLGAMFTFVNFFALNPGMAWPKWNIIMKILLMTLLAILIIDSQNKLRILILVVIFSLGFYGLKGGLFSILTGGQFRTYGPPESFIESNNGLGLALNMVIPFFIYFPKEEKSVYLKTIMYVLLVCSIITVAFTYSRGAILGLFVVLSLMLLKSKMKYKLATIFFLLILVPLIYSSIPEKWYERVSSIETYEKDDSSMARIEAWRTAWRLALDRPLTGGGFQALEDKSLYDIYNPTSRYRGDVHSVYFEALSEGGFITFGLFAALLVSSLLSLRSLRKEIVKSANTPDNKWLIDYSHMVEIGIIGYMISGAFLELLTFDLIYTQIAIVVILKNIWKGVSADMNTGKISAVPLEAG